MAKIVESKSEWWICDVTGCENEVEFMISVHGTSANVCWKHGHKGDRSFKDEGIPVATEGDENVWLNWDDEAEEWWLGDWDDEGDLLNWADINYKTIGEAMKAWKDQDFSWEKDEDYY